MCVWCKVKCMKSNLLYKQVYTQYSVSAWYNYVFTNYHQQQTTQKSSDTKIKHFNSTRISENIFRIHAALASSEPPQLRFILLPQPRRWSSLYSSKCLASCNSFGSSLSIFNSLSASSSSETRFGFPIAAISCSDCGFCLLGSGQLEKSIAKHVSQYFS